MKLLKTGLTLVIDGYDERMDEKEKEYKALLTRIEKLESMLVVCN